MQINLIFYNDNAAVLRFCTKIADRRSHVLNFEIKGPDFRFNEQKPLTHRLSIRRLFQPASIHERMILASSQRVARTVHSANKYIVKIFAYSVARRHSHTTMLSEEPFSQNASAAVFLSSRPQFAINLIFSWWKFL